MSTEDKSSRRYIPFFGCLISTKHSHFEAAVRLALPRLGIELVDVEGCTCCPDPIYYRAANSLDWLTIAARNLCLAEDVGLDMFTCCSGCTLTLKEANHTLKQDADMRAQVNKRLKKIGREFKGTIRVRHISTILRDDVGLDAVAASVVRSLNGLRVAIHYGCHLLKPKVVMEVEDPFHPEMLQNLIRAIGAKPVFSMRHLLCCGKACQNKEMSNAIMYDNVSEFRDLDVDAIGLICPTCFDEYDLGQMQLSRIRKDTLKTPVFYYFQLLALAQGFTPEQLALKRHRTSVNSFLAKMDEMENQSTATQPVDRVEVAV